MKSIKLSQNACFFFKATSQFPLKLSFTPSNQDSSTWMVYYIVVLIPEVYLLFPLTEQILQVNWEWQREEAILSKDN